MRKSCEHKNIDVISGSSLHKFVRCFHCWHKNYTPNYNLTSRSSFTLSHGLYTFSFQSVKHYPRSASRVINKTMTSFPSIPHLSRREKSISHIFRINNDRLILVGIQPRNLSDIRLITFEIYESVLIILHISYGRERELALKPLMSPTPRFTHHSPRGEGGWFIYTIGLPRSQGFRTQAKQKSYVHVHILYRIMCYGRPSRQRLKLHLSMKWTHQ